MSGPHTSIRASSGGVSALNCPSRLAPPYNTPERTKASWSALASTSRYAQVPRRLTWVSLAAHAACVSDLIAAAPASVPDIAEHMYIVIGSSYLRRLVRADSPKRRLVHRPGTAVRSVST
eukprot:1698517-Rhodomonas_salina.5